MLVKATSRRCQARVARALTGVACSGIGLQSVMRISFRSGRQDAKLRSVPATHCADLLTARENLRCCNVRSYQKECDKALCYLTTDRGAPCALYPAIKRSVVCTSTVLRYPLPPPSDKNKDKQDANRFRLDSAQLICRFFVDRRCSSRLLVERGQNALASK
jgi:hypothetical protein